MSFYKRSLHSFLGQTNAKTMPFKDDLGGVGFDEEEANGLMLCTEYLGFESYDMRMSENEVENKMTCRAEEETERVERKRRKRKEENVVAPAREGKKEFPPPLSSLNGRGRRSFYLRPVRKDGRLELTQVMIDRHEIFHASREDGRLRLQLVDAYCDFEETVDLEGLERPHLESGEGIEEANDATSDQVVDLSMNNDYKSSHEVLLNNNDDDYDVAHLDDAHDAREWRYKSCYEIVTSMNHDVNDHHNHHHHHHHHHHHMHPYHYYNSNHNMHLWCWSYVKTM